MNMYEHEEHETYLNNSLTPFAFECVVFVYVLYHPIFISLLNLFNNIHKLTFSPRPRTITAIRTSATCLTYLIVFHSVNDITL